MSSFYAELHLDGQRYPVVHCSYEVFQGVDPRGRATSKVRHGRLQLTLDVPDSEQLLAWAAAPTYPLDGDVVFYDPAGGHARETLSFAAGECVSYEEEFRVGDQRQGAYACTLAVASPKLSLRAGGPAQAYVPPAAREYAAPVAAAIAAPVAAAVAAPLGLMLKREGLEGVEKASAALIATVAAKRNLRLASTPDELRYLEYIGAEANVGGENLSHILVKDPPGKAALLEEFLHGTQYKLGLVKGVGDLAFAEWHVKDFMVRHAKLLGLGEEDVTILRQLRDRDYQNWQGV
jgi:hypothetical protein